ncbi:malonic semialdehyde reductase [Paucibacter sp. R3-3]|uniref:Putative NADH dehydrogenase/NAD(P)H nitroreductase SNE35_07315 n=1 Tax=Roseateles agri TaxID=3098619 RepID=A0ABU5DDF2_9BURK|nr:malonic semialdehyde reductase [Paucibacter sp. R3-3]MDY0744308.1 malonic semialdehyde reductase [Paucibacter sp. R3-3]
MTAEALSPQALDQLFRTARTFNKFSDRPVDEATLRQLHELWKWGPTAMNSQPARVVFVQSAEAKEKLKPTLSAGNVDKTMAAPVTAIVAYDSRFYDQLATQFPAAPGAGARFEADPQGALQNALRGSTLQGAYLILAARALGLDCGPMGGFDASKLDAAFFPDGQWRSNFLVNIGWGDPSGNRPRGPRLSFEDAVRIV